jgi:hypothetical protein
MGLTGCCYLTDQSWFLMTSSYSRRFCLGITQCGPLFAICLTDHGGNYTTLDLDVTKQDCTAMFEPSLDCTDLSATDKVLDGFKQKVRDYVLTKLCKAAD